MADKIPGTVEAWEHGALGNDDRYVRRASELLEREVDEALGLQAISIRLPRATIETYKMLAEMHGVGYQPLMRDAICRWAEGELKQMLIAEVEQRRQDKRDAGQETPATRELDFDPGPERKAA